jgi:hypothetical protein
MIISNEKLGIGGRTNCRVCLLGITVQEWDGTLRRPLVVLKFRNFISASRQFLQCFHFELCIHQRLF